MKSFVTLLACVAAVGVLAQGKMAQKPPYQDKVGPGKPAGMHSGQRGGGFMMGMKDLNLSAAQKAKIDAIMQKQRSAWQALRNQKLTEKERSAKMMAMRKNMMSQIRNVLDAKQRAKWDAEMKKRAAMRAKGFMRPPAMAPGKGKGGG